MPGIDSAHLAMDTEEGVEVVWNEVCYSNRKMVKGTRVRWCCVVLGFNTQCGIVCLCMQEGLVKILQKLTEVKHTNIVNFVSFWHDKMNSQDRVCK